MGRLLFLLHGYLQCFIVLSLVFIFASQASGASFRIADRTKLFVQEISPDSVALAVNNDFAVPLSLEINLRLENLESDTSKLLPVIPPKVYSYIIAKFKRTISGAPYKCLYSLKAILGDVSKVADPDYPYAYPYLSSWSYPISQGPGGSFSHKHTFAYDFAMPVGTLIVAVRDGVVGTFKSDSKTGGPDPKYSNAANFISVFHEDGTIARYVHLNTGGVIVREGQQVTKGQIIGFSGNTGYSTGPHLHLEIIQPHLDSKEKRYVSFRWEGPAFAFLPYQLIPEQKYKRSYPKKEPKPPVRDNQRVQRSNIFKTAFYALLSVFV